MPVNETIVIVGRDQLRDLVRLAPMLYEVIEEARRVWPQAKMTLGSMHRTLAEEKVIEHRTGKPTSKIHTALPVRACDLPMRYRGTVDARWESCGRVARGLNRAFVYDPVRPTIGVAFAAKHGTGPHVHLQVHPATIRRRRA